MQNVLMTESQAGGGRTTRAQDRQQAILSLAREVGSVDVTAAAKTLGVSAETVRRDLTHLESRGLVRRSYGVAYAVESGLFETDLPRREVEHLAEKQRLALEAVKHLDDAQTIFIDEGFTPRLIASSLPPDRALTVVTASLPIAIKLAENPSCTVIVLGGRVRPNTLGTVESWATHMLENFVIDTAFIGANGISRQYGLTTPDPSVGEVKAAAIKSSRRRIFVGHHMKFGVASFCRFGAVEDLDLIITGTRLSPQEAQRLTFMGPRVLRV